MTENLCQTIRKIVLDILKIILFDDLGLTMTWPVNEFQLAANVNSEHKTYSL